MKIIALIFSVFFMLEGSPNKLKTRYRLTRCLGREELNLHQSKVEDYNYYLNQILLSHLVQLEDVTLKDQYYQQVCTKKQGRSFRMLRVFLTHFEKSFKKLPTSKPKQFSQSLLKKFVSLLPSIFINFLVHVKKHSPDAKCLRERVPELGQLEKNIMDLQGHMSFKRIIWKNKLIEKTLNKLENQNLFSGCQSRNAVNKSNNS